MDILLRVPPQLRIVLAARCFFFVRGKGIHISMRDIYFLFVFIF